MLAFEWIIGLLLGAVWSPCVGPTLGAASILAAKGENLGQVALTMLAFGVGAALPLLVIGLLSREAMQRWQARLWARELLTPSPFLSELIDREAMPKVRLVLALLGEVTGIPAQEPALLRCLFSVIAPYLTLQVISREIPTPLTGLFEQPPEDLARHLQLFAQAGLEAVARDYRDGRL